MKQLFNLLAVILTFPIVGQSQTNVFPSTGNVGIGTTSPGFPLEVRTSSSASSGFHAGSVLFSEQTSATTGNVTGASGQSKVSNPSGNVALGIGLSGSCEVSGSGATNEIRAVAGQGVLSGPGDVTNWSCFWGGFGVSGSGTVTNGFGLFINPFPANVINKWGVFVNDATAKNYFAGTIGVGTQNVGSFKLAVEGKIGAREVQVTNTSPWPDYVFNNNYKLMDIDALNEYIRINNHLPDMPSAEEVKDGGGVELGDMTSRLVKKVEELTLYVIELKKENEKIREQLEKFSGK